MLDYYNERTLLDYHIEEEENYFVNAIFNDFYGGGAYWYDGHEVRFMWWLCQENLIGKELTPEIYALWELSK